MIGGFRSLKIELCSRRTKFVKPVHCVQEHMFEVVWYLVKVVFGKYVYHFQNGSFLELYKISILFYLIQPNEM